METGINSEFVTYELCVKLKALGFDEPCMGYRTEKGNTLSFKMKITNSKLDKEAAKWRATYKGVLRNRVAAPLWQQAFRWFKELGYDVEPYLIDPKPWLENQIESEFDNREMRKLMKGDNF